MGNLDRFDDEAMQRNADDAAREEIRQKNAKIKHYMLFAGKLFLWHIVAFILYVFLFSSAADAESFYDTGYERKILAIFGVMATFVFSLFTSFELWGDGVAKRSYKDLLRSVKYELKIPAKMSLLGILPCSIVYFAFQIPGVIFYHIFGYSYFNPMIIDKFYTMDIGMMELTGIGIVGAVINTVLFAAFLYALRMYIYHSWKREKENFDKEEKMPRKYG